LGKSRKIGNNPNSRWTEKIQCSKIFRHTYTKGEDFIEKEQEKEDNGKLNICYVRVSTMSQKDDLERQKKYMTEKYHDYKLIEDIGSGINFNRRGLIKIINYAIKDRVNKWLWLTKTD
jgi:predicted site-specific integrase-resolvase